MTQPPNPDPDHDPDHDHHRSRDPHPHPDPDKDDGRNPKSDRDPDPIRHPDPDHDHDGDHDHYGDHGRDPKHGQHHEQDRAKEAAGRAAAALVEPGMRVGLGTGSTVHWTIVALGERAAELDLTCVATSARTHALATSLGLRVVAPDEVEWLDVTIDGADEVDASTNLIKGGGGAHTREKIVAAMARRFVVVVDHTKMVAQLGPFGVPLEVLDFAPETVARSVRALGAARVDRLDARTDNGNLLLRAYLGPIAEPVVLAAALAAVPGLVDHGIFPGSMVSDIFIAGTHGVQRRAGGVPGRA